MFEKLLYLGRVNFEPMPAMVKFSLKAFIESFDLDKEEEVTRRKGEET